MEQAQAEIVRRWLGENGVEATAALVAIVQTLVGRHVDCELEKIGRRRPHGGQPRANALTAAMDALHEGRYVNASADAELAELQKLLMALLGECQFAAEDAAGIGGDDPPPMRIG